MAKLKSRKHQEEVFLDDVQPSGNNGRLKVRLILFTVIFALIASGVFLYGLNKHWWFYDGSVDYIDTSEVAESETSEISFEYGKYNDVIAYGDSIVRYSNQKLEWIDEDGSVISSSEDTLQNPIYKGNGDYFIVGEKDNTRVYLYKNNSLEWKVNIDGKVINVDVNDSGFVTVVKSYPGYKTACDIYDPKGNCLSSIMRAETKIINAIVMNSNESVAFIEIDTYGANVLSNVICMDFKGQEIYSKEYSNVILFKIRTLENDRCAVVGSNCLSILAADGEQLTYIKYNNIVGMEKLSDGAIAVAGVPKEDIDAEGTIVEIFTSTGVLRARYDFATNINSIDAGNGAIAINSGKKLIVIDDAGNVVGGCTLDREIMNMRFMSKKRILISSSDRGIFCKYK